MNCQICSPGKPVKFLSLGMHPNPDYFPTKQQLGNPEPKYPLDVYFCDNCKLVQLGHIVAPELLFTSDFIYTTGSSDELVRNFNSLVGKIVSKFKLKKGDLAVDIGSNDGTLLENYLPHGVKVLGVDPSKAAELAMQKNVPTLLEFFNEKTAEKISMRHGKAKIITATNVFAHVADLDSFMKGILALLDEKGAFIQESHYLLDMVSKMEYDSIYLEHLRYYSLKPLIHLFNNYGMDVFDAEKIQTHGGSLRVYACRKGAFPISSNVHSLLEAEEKAGLFEKETFISFAKKVAKNKALLLEILSRAKREKKRIFGIGAPAKGNTLLNYCGIGTDVLDCLVEKQNLKVGRFSPGMRIEIVEESRLFEQQPEYALLLAWNMENIIIPKLRQKGYKGKFIVPVPEPRIV